MITLTISSLISKGVIQNRDLNQRVLVFYHVNIMKPITGTENCKNSTKSGRDKSTKRDVFSSK